MTSSLDTNRRIAALLREMAAAQKTPQKRWGYGRAAEAILALEAPIESFVRRDGSLRKIPNVGPSSTRVILEALATGRSASVEEAVRQSPRATRVAQEPALAEHFLSAADVAAALRTKAPHAPRLSDYRGDLQMHSIWSDGRATLDDIAEGCLARGYRYCAITDHAGGLAIAGGLSMADVKKQHRDVDATNKRFGKRFRMLKGIEANILADGQLDLSEGDRRQLEVVVAAPHSKLRTADDQTARLIKAIRAPGVHILGHPRGRKFGSRPGVQAKWDRVFATAATFGVAIEIDGDPSRQDIDFVLAKRALDAGCFFALDSDAHSVSELAYAETAIAHARLAGIPRTRVVNCWELEQLREWLALAWLR